MNISQYCPTCGNITGQYYTPEPKKKPSERIIEIEGANRSLAGGLSGPGKATPASYIQAILDYLDEQAEGK